MSTRTFQSQRGAIVVQVAVSILVLSAFAMFIVDYGVLWVSRSQAQNAADSGAMAGAIAMAFDDYTNRAASGPAKQAARSFALANSVFGENPVVNMATDVRFFGDSPGAFPNVCGDDSCVRVDVYRNVARGNPLPVFFGWIVGLADQGVRATATAQVSRANASECLKPWGLADRWAENNPVVASEWLPESTFDPTGPTPDVYVPPSGGGAGTSFRTAGDLGRELVLKAGASSDVAINGGWFQALNVGGGWYSEAITGCAKRVWGIGEVIPREGGDVAGATRDAAEELIALDPDAEWNGEKVINSCVGPPYACATPGHSHSPRLVALPIFHLQQYLSTGGPGSGTVRVVNIVGLFVDHLAGNDVVGYLATKPDLKVQGASTVAIGASFIKAVQLVR